MRMNFIILLSCMLLVSCEKDPKPTPSEEPPATEKIVKWIVDMDVSEYKNEITMDPVLYGDWIITGYASNDWNVNVPLLIAFDKNTGEKLWEYQHPEWPVSFIRNMKSKDHYLILKFRDGMVCLDIRDRSIIWQSSIPE